MQMILYGKTFLHQSQAQKFLRETFYFADRAPFHFLEEIPRKVVKWYQTKNIFVKALYARDVFKLEIQAKLELKSKLFQAPAVSWIMSLKSLIFNPYSSIYIAE